MLTRREFIAGASGLAAAAATRGLAAPEPRPAVPAIDSHVHYVDPTRPQGAPWPPKTDVSIYRPHLPEAFVAMTAPFNILGEIVIEASPWLADNQWVLDLARNHSSIVGFIGHLSPGKAEFVQNLDRFAANPIFRGIRVPGTALPEAEMPVYRRDLDRLADHRFTLDVVSAGSALPELVQLAGRHPTLRVVIDHLPFTEWDGRPAAMRAALAPVADCPNIFAKVSAVVRLRDGRNISDPAFYRPGLDALWDLFGSKRVLYASNWPASARTATYADIYQAVAPYVAARSRQDQEDFYWRNSIAAYSWKPRGAAAALRQGA